MGNSINNSSQSTVQLSKLPIGKKATIVGFNYSKHCNKKFADVGLVTGMPLLMEGKAPFGKLLRIKVLGSSLALYSDDVENIIVKL